MEIDVLVFGVNLYNWLHINNNAKKITEIFRIFKDII